MQDRIVTAMDGTSVYVTIDGDMVDQIAHRVFGRHGRNTEAVYDINPGLAALGPVLQAGIVIKLPSVQQEVTPRQFRKLWD